jgi:dienelactone hydrolase
MFDYDRAQPLYVKQNRVEGKQDGAVWDLSFDGQAGRRVSAYLVTPPGTGPFPAILYVHPAPGNRDNFLDEATALAQQGALGLLIEAPWAQGEAWGRTLGEPEHDRLEFIHIAIDMRRAVDVLESRSEVDARWIGFVGHSFGALLGGILAGVEKRIGSLALMAGTGSFTDLARLSMPFLEGPALESYSQGMARIDPIYYIGQAAPAALLFQFSRNDEAFPRANVEAFAAAGSEPKTVKWYDADHFLNNEARRDRQEWFRKQLRRE